MSAAVSHDELNASARRGADLAGQHLDALTRAYARALRAAGRRAASEFRQTETLTAAANPHDPPDWTPPPTGSVIDAAALAADTKRKTAKLHEAMLTAAAEEILQPLGLSFDITAPTSQALLDAVGRRIQDGIASAISEQISNAIKAGYANGDSVSRVSKAIQAATYEISRPRADMLARTDLNALANGGSLLAASVSGAAATKTWLTAGDDLVRDTHADADGQTVAIDDVFDVGGESAQYPGDPELSDEEACNCRCTLVYGEPLTASARTNGSGVLQAEQSVMFPVRLDLPRQRAPIVKVTAAAPEVHVRNEVAPPDMIGLERIVGQLGPLLAAATEGQRVELADALAAVAAAVQRDLPVPTVTVGAAQVDVPAADMSGIGPAIVSGLAPYLQELVQIARDIQASVNAPRTKRMVVNRAKSGEISNLTVEED